MHESSQIPLLRSFAPFYGIFVGASIGWFVMYSVNSTGEAPLVWPGRLQAITNSLLMWSLFTALFQGREIYGGGLLTREPNQNERVLLLGMGLFLVWVFSLVSFVAKNITVFYIFTFVMLVGLISEVGWRNPFKLLSVISR
jgi:hypothetical protein